MSRNIVQVKKNILKCMASLHARNTNKRKEIGNYREYLGGLRLLQTKVKRLILCIMGSGP